MKQVTVKLYEFSELGENVRNKLIERNRWNIGDDAMEGNSCERESTLHKFEDLFGISVNYDVSYCGYSYSVSFDDAIYQNSYCSEKEWYIEADDVKGKLLLRYLNSKYFDLTSRKCYYGKFKWNEKGESITKKRHSKILRYSCCPLTGVCYDEDILDPIRKFLAKPNMTISLKDLIDNCVSEFILSWYHEWEYCCDNDDFLAENFANRHEGDLFFEDGRIFNGIIEDVA